MTSQRYFTGVLSSVCASGKHAYCYGWFWNQYDDKQRCLCAACEHEETI